MKAILEKLLSFLLRLKSKDKYLTIDELWEKSTMTKKEIDNSFTFEGFDTLKFLKGRRRMIATVIGGYLGMVIGDSVLVGTLSGAFTEILFGLIEFYLKK